ncbi:hypothetical protein MA9V1_183 [Chryseobacterium phage MA9V-1]|nr:hypothetical protein MA9V1_183 [Chryseobacterium phage MA9V-1]
MNFNKNEAYGIGGEKLTYKGQTSTANKVYHAFVNESGSNVFLTAEQINEATNGSADEEVYNQWAELLLQHIGVTRAKKYLNANDINKELKAMLDANHDMESDILYDKAMNAKLIAAVSRRRKAAGYVNENESSGFINFINEHFERRRFGSPNFEVTDRLDSQLDGDEVMAIAEKYWKGVSKSISYQNNVAYDAQKKLAKYFNDNRASIDKADFDVFASEYIAASKRKLDNKPAYTPPPANRMETYADFITKNFPVFKGFRFPEVKGDKQFEDTLYVKVKPADYGALAPLFKDITAYIYIQINSNGSGDVSYGLKGTTVQTGKEKQIYKAGWNTKDGGKTFKTLGWD